MLIKGQMPVHWTCIEEQFVASNDEIEESNTTPVFLQLTKNDWH